MHRLRTNPEFVMQVPAPAIYVAKKPSARADIAVADRGV
jgi:hypothetical protein